MGSRPDAELAPYLSEPGRNTASRVSSPRGQYCPMPRARLPRTARQATPASNATTSGSPPRLRQHRPIAVHGRREGAWAEVGLGPAAPFGPCDFRGGVAGACALKAGDRQPGDRERPGRRQHVRRQDKRSETDRHQHRAAERTVPIWWRISGVTRKATTASTAGAGGQVPV